MTFPFLTSKSTLLTQFDMSLQPFSQEFRTPTVPREFQIGLYGVVESDLGIFFHSWSAGFSENGCNEGSTQYYCAAYLPVRHRSNIEDTNTASTLRLRQHTAVMNHRGGGAYKKIETRKPTKRRTTIMVAS